MEVHPARDTAGARCSDLRVSYLRRAGSADALDRGAAHNRNWSGEANGFDFVFIDADKTNYANYNERALARVRPRGSIAVDNVLWYGRIIDASFDDPDTRAIRAFNEQLKNDERVWLSILPIRDGLTLACKK